MGGKRILSLLSKIKAKYYRSSFASRGEWINYLRGLGVTIGEECDIFNTVNFGSEPYLVTIGNRVKMTTGVRLITHDGGVHVLRNLGLLPNADIYGEIVIGDNVFVGNNVIIMPGVEIGENSIIGAGSVVTRSIPPNSIAAGVPARVIRDIHAYYEKYKDKADMTKSMNAAEKRAYLVQKYNLPS